MAEESTITADSVGSPWRASISQAFGLLRRCAGRSRQVAATTALLLALGFAFDMVGYAPGYLRILGFGLSLLVAAVLLGCSHPKSVILLAATVFTLGSKASPAVQLPLLLLLHLAVWQTGVRGPLRLYPAVAVYLLLHLFLFYSPWGFQVLDWLAVPGNRAATALSGEATLTAYTYQGTGASLLFLTIAGLQIRSRRQAIAWSVFACMGLAAALAWQAFFLYRVDFGTDLMWKFGFRTPLTSTVLLKQLGDAAHLATPAVPFLIWLALLTLSLMFVTKSPGDAKPSAPTGSPSSAPPSTRWHERPAIRWGILGLAVLLYLASALALGLPRLHLPVRGQDEIVFCSRGVVSFSFPGENQFGTGLAGMFGSLPILAESFGFPARVVDGIPEDLSPSAILVITNPDQPLREGEYDRLWAHVRAGGGLFLLGDHTFIKNGRNHLNDLLAPTAIRFRHDSAQFFPQGWFDCYRFRAVGGFGGLRDDAENGTGFLVGASLATSAPAFPIIVGRYGYSDWGTTEKVERREYLGDFVPQRSERLGDLVLAAGQDVGRGRVLVFGDTTALFNGNIARTYPVFRSALTFLRLSRTTPLGGNWGLLLTGGLFLGICALVIATGARSAGVSACILLVAAIHPALPGRAERELPLQPDWARSRTAVVDYCHHPRVSDHGSMKTALSGLSINMLRSKRVPLQMRQWDPSLLDCTDLLVITAPRQQVTTAQVDELMRFMERGGRLVVACGRREYPACRNLLDRLDISVADFPLGRTFEPQAWGEKVSFFESWALELGRSLDQSNVLASYMGHPLMATVDVGLGGAVVIGDSQFLLNQNLEMKGSHDPRNIAFVRKLVEWKAPPTDH